MFILEKSLNTLMGSRCHKYNGVQTQVQRTGKDLKQQFMTSYLQWLVCRPALGTTDSFPPSSDTCWLSESFQFFGQLMYHVFQTASLCCVLWNRWSWKMPYFFLLCFEFLFWFLFFFFFYFVTSVLIYFNLLTPRELRKPSVSLKLHIK